MSSNRSSRDDRHNGRGFDDRRDERRDDRRRDDRRRDDRRSYDRRDYDRRDYDRREHDRRRKDDQGSSRGDADRGASARRSPPPDNAAEARPRKRERGFRYDSPPKDGALSPGFQGAASGATDGRGPLLPSYVLGGQGPTTAIPSELSASAIMKGASTDDVRSMREVYVGNFRAGMSPSQLGDFIGSTMVAMKMNYAPSSPVVRAWASQDGQYAFLELRTIEEANNCVELSGLQCAGHDLVIGRTQGYPDKMMMYKELQEPTVKADKSIKGGIAGLAQNAPTASFTAMNSLAPQSGMSAMSQSMMGGGMPSMPPTMAPGGFSSMGMGGAMPMKTGGFSAVGGGAHGGLQLLQSNLTQAPDVLCITGLPPSNVMPEDDVVELLETFGAIREVIHIPFGKLFSGAESSSMAAALGSPGQPSGHDTDIDSSVVLVSYLDPADGISVRDYLHGWSWAGGKYRLTVGPGDTLWHQIQDTNAFLKVAALVESMSKMPSTKRVGQLTEIPSRCLWLPSILTYSECRDEDLYFELLEDLEDEIRLFSDVWDIKIPRPVAKQLYPEEELRSWKDLRKAVQIKTKIKEEETPESPEIPASPDDAPPPAEEEEEEEDVHVPMDVLPFDINDSDVGHCFVEFATVSDATRIRNLFNGRTYNERQVVFHYFNEQLMLDQKFTNPCALYSLHGSSLFSEKLMAEHKRRRVEVSEEREDRRQKDETALAIREEKREKERQEMRRLEAEAELMAAEEVARRRQLQQTAMQEMGGPQIYQPPTYSNVAVTAGTNIAAAQASGKLVQDDDSDMGMSDD